MSLLSQFFPSTAGGSNATGDFGAALTSDLSAFPIDVLLIGGGGGGGIVPSTKNAACPGSFDPNAAIGGGGGGGRVIQMLGAVVTTGTSYPITVGAGGGAGCNGGATCFGNTLVAGGGGGAGTPGTFGRGDYELFDKSETSGNYGDDTVYTACPTWMVHNVPSPASPYFVDKSNCVYRGRRYITCVSYSDTVAPITYYDCVCPQSSISRNIRSEVTYNGPSPYTPWQYDSAPLFPSISGAATYNGKQAGSSFNCGYYGCKGIFNEWSGVSPSFDCYNEYNNAIFKKINHPAIYCSFFGMGGMSGHAIGYMPTSTSTAVPYVCGHFGRTSMPVVNTLYGGSQGIFDLQCWYQQGALNNCFPQAILYHCPSCPNVTGELYNPLGYLNPYTPSPVVLVNSCTVNSELRAAKGARAQFCPVSNDAIRAAMLLTNNYSVTDHGPALWSFPMNQCYSASTPNTCYTTYTPIYYEVNNTPCNNFYQVVLGGNGVYDACNTGGRGCVTPSYYTVIEPQNSPCILRMRVFTPNTCTVGVQSSFTGCYAAQYLPIVSATTNPVVDAAVWTAADNGTAGWGGGGGGGVNMSGIATALVYRYQYTSAFPCVNASAADAPWPGAVYPGNEGITTNALAFSACPVVCYFRCIGPSPAPVATGGSGGSGAVYVVYPTNYPAATATGNTPVPSPPAYRVYYWTGNGTITFNQ